MSRSNYVAGGAMDPEEQRAYEEELLFGEATETLFGLVKSAGITRKEFAQRLEVSPGRVSQILAGGANLTLRTLAACGWALGVRFRLTAAEMENRASTPAAQDPPLPDWVDAERQSRVVSKPLRRDDCDRVRELPPGWGRFIVLDGRQRAA